MVPEEVVRFSRKYHSTSDSTEFVNVAEKHLSMFEETVRVQAKFNRMVIYSADDYHAQTTYGVKGGPDRLLARGQMGGVHLPLCQKSLWDPPRVGVSVWRKVEVLCYFI